MRKKTKKTKTRKSKWPKLNRCDLETVNKRLEELKENKQQASLLYKQLLNRHIELMDKVYKD